MGWGVMQVDNIQYMHFKQDFDNECGPSCVVMIARIFDKGLSMNDCRYKVAGVDGRHQASFSSNWTLDWSYISSLAYVLSSQGIQNARTRKNLSANNYKKLVFEESSPKTPSILRVQWRNKFTAPDFLYTGGHFVVCFGKSTVNENLVNILDPGYDTGPVLVPNWGLYPDYAPPYGGYGYLDRNYSISTK